ncbi:MAG: sterol desaturase family protein [Myxococcaceae bacterium]|nr:sterol desaturase family protein [Myxococcaceae bacterium]
MRRALPRVAYAASVVAAPAAVYALGGMGWRLDLAVLLVVSVAGFFVGFAERAAPFERVWNTSLGDSGVDTLHLVLSTLGVDALFIASAGVFPRLEVWPASLPLLAQVALAIVVGEFGAYWAHRWMHETRLLWRVHLVHHSARRLHSLNASRNHPLDMLVLLVAAGGPLLVLGAPPLVLALAGAFAITHLQYQHANTTLELGVFNWLLAGPELHRWHHSRVPAEANGNYGHVLIVWDVLFRTRLAPEGRRPPADVGLFAGENLEERYWPQLLSPFK